MKRTFISFGLIVLFIVAVLATDLIFTTHFADGMLKRLDEMETAETHDGRKIELEELVDFYEENDFLAHRLILTNRMDELDMLIYRLVAFSEAEDEHEVAATMAELRARIHSLYSTWIYHWYHPRDFGIE